MKTQSFSRWLIIAVMAGSLSAVCQAQTTTPAPAPKKPAAARPAPPPPDDINPGVDTSAEDHQVHDTTPANSSAASRSAESAAAAAPAPAPAKSGTGKGAAGAKKAAPAPAGDPAKPTAKGPSKLDLDRTQITGNSELPKVMAIVPWKRADLGDAGRPMNSLLDEVLQPIDRDVFQRQTRYYDALKPDSAGPAAAATGGSVR